MFENNIRISQKMKNESQLSIQKKSIMKSEKIKTD